MPTRETAIPVPFALVDKMPVHAGVGDTERMPIKDLAIEPRKEIAPKALFPSLPERVLRPLSHIVNAYAQARLVWRQ